MRKATLLCLLLPVLSYAQDDRRLHLTLFGGLTNYQGDLQGKAFTLNQSNLGVGIGLKYDLTPHLAVRGGIMYGSVEASDRLSTDSALRARNLSFVSKIFEGNLLLEYTFFNLQDKKISPYVFGGIAAYHFNPYASDTLGNKVYLKPLSTEGQGLPGYTKEYKLTQFAIPFGGGIKFRVSRNVVLAYEIGLRKLFTDHLDDVSGRYVDQVTLGTERGAKAVEMAYRGNQLKGADPTFYPADGELRGSAKAKDWYYFQGLTLSIGLGGSGGEGSGGGGGRARGNRLGCPRNVF